jgi:hypothetical protein
LSQKFPPSDGEYFTPLRGKALGEFPLLHAPPASDPLAGKTQRITPVNPVDRIHDSHESGLFILFCQRALSEQIRLESTLWGNLLEIHASLFVPEPILVNPLERVERSAYQIRGKGRGVGKVDGKRVGIVLKVRVKRIGFDTYRQTGGQRVLFPQLFCCACIVAGNRFLQLFPTGYFPAECFGTQNALLWRSLELKRDTGDAPEFEHNPLACYGQILPDPLFI